MVSFSSTSVAVVAGVFFELCYGHALEPSPGGQVWTPGRPRVLDQAADDFLPNLLLSPASGPGRGVHCADYLLELAGTSKSHIFQGSGRAFVPRAVPTFIRNFHVSPHVQIKRQNFK